MKVKILFAMASIVALTVEAAELPKFATAAGDFREGAPMWHIQGMAIGEDAVYMCEGKALFKFDLETGRRVKAVQVPLHSGDICLSDGKVYCAVAYGVSAGEHSATEHGRITVYDADLNLIAEKRYPVLFDGITALDGVLYVGVCTMERQHHRKCRIMRVDQKTLDVIDVREIDPGFEMEYGVQDMATDGQNILMAFYAYESRNAMAVYTKDLEFVSAQPFSMGHGFDFMPSRFDLPGRRVVAKLDCFRDDPKAPATKPHGLDIRSRFEYHMWDGKDLKAICGQDCAVGTAKAGVWCYKPYEYEAWMLQKMTEEVDRGVLHVGWPGKYLTLDKEPEAFYSEKPVEGYEAIRGEPGVPPHRRPRPETVIEPVKKGEVYDLGRLDVGYVQIEPEWSLGNRPGLYVGESIPEALNTDAEHFEQSLLVRAEGEYDWRSDIPLMARYIRLTGPKILSVKFRSQIDWRESVGRFVCGDARKEKIWSTGVETLRRCRRTFLLDGIKRDRLPWAADMAVEILAEAYTFGDAEIVKRSIAAVGSGDMTQGTVNGIGPYSLWWIIDHDLLQRYFDEPAYLKLHYPKIKARMAEIATHEDERGFYVRDLGWDFLDWTDDKGGEVDSVISRQVLYFGALRAAVRLAERMHDAVSAAAWAKKADDLRGKILEVGMDRTRHARIFAILFNLADEAGTRRYADELSAEDLNPTMTPFMASLEVMALLQTGRVAPALKKFESVWGEMVDFGVDCYWEGWNRQAKGDDVYVFYRRRFGKSLCHGWSSGPAFLIPGWFYGIRPTADGWKAHEVKPACADFAPNARVSVPVPGGRLDVSFVNGKQN